MSPQEKLALVQLARSVQWRYALDEWEESPLRELLRAVRQSQTEILSQIEARAATLTEWREERSLALLDEMSDLTLGLRQQLGESISEITAFAGAESYLVHNDILSFGSLVNGFNNVALTASQLKSMITDTPIGGRTLQTWIDDAFDWQIKDRIKQEIASGLLQGEGYPKLAARLRQGLGLAGDDAVTVARSYVQAINVHAAHDVAKANKEIMQGWKWRSAAENGAFYVKSGKGRGRGICLACAAMDSKDEIYLLDSGPEIPMHPRCFPGQTKVSAPGALVVMRAKYHGPIINIGLDNGSTISVTPNHRVLTIDGFKSAGEIEKHDKFICDFSHRQLAISGKYNYGLPSTLEQIFNLFRKRFKSVIKNPVTSEDFHGDGEFINGDIDIIAPESLLKGDFETLFYKDLPNLFFPNPHVRRVDLPGLSKSTAMLIAMGLATQAATGGLSMADAFSLCHGDKSVGGGLTHGPDSYPRFNEPVPDSAFANTESLSQFVRRLPPLISFADIINGKIDPMVAGGPGLLDFIRHFAFGENGDILSQQSALDWLRSPPQDFANFFLRLPGKIEPCNIKFLRKGSFDGHVYDLQTFSSVYYVEGIMSSNCRCLREYITKSWRDLGIPVDEIDRVARPYTIRGKGIDPLTGEIQPMSVGTGGRPILNWGKFLGDYEDFLVGQSEMVQKATLGPNRLRLWKEGKITLGDLVTIENGKARLLTLKELPS